MSREIKFRVYSKSLKIMDTPFLLDGEFDCVSGWLGENEILMQYTGLKDKNGIEIYEGDIVSTLDKTSREKPYIGEVKWNDLVTGFEAHSQELHHGLFLHGPNATDNLIKELKQFMRHPRTIEVIGNIYENPELL